MYFALSFIIRTNNLVMRLLIFISLALSLSAFASKEGDEAKQNLFAQAYYDADAFIYEENFEKAIDILSGLLEKQPDNANLHFRIGYSYLHTSTGKYKAQSHLEKAVQNVSENADLENFSEKNAPLEAFFYLGKAYHINYEFDKAIEAYNTMKHRLIDKTGNYMFIKNINRHIEISNYAIELTSNPVELKSRNLGKIVNSKYTDHSPVVSVDESMLIFTSTREGSSYGHKGSNGEYFEDIYISYKENNQWGDPVSISPSINTTGHEASIALSVNGQELLIYKDDNGDGNIYMSRLNGTQWTTPKSLGKLVNTKYNENHASLSVDGRALYFTSNRPGGFGGMDIYVTKKLPNGEWGQPQNMGPEVNTEYDDLSPFIHPDGTTLFFSSEGHKNMGGQDIFYCKVYDDGTTSAVTNMGYPINSTDDDLFYSLTPDGKRAYYSSFKKDGLGDTDIYLIELDKAFNRPLAVISGKVFKEDSENADDITISVTDEETGETVGIYRPNYKTGKYIFILDTDKKYVAEYESETYLRGELKLNIPSDLSYYQTEKEAYVKDILLKRSSKYELFVFDFEQESLSDEIKAQLDKAGKFLQENKGFYVKFSLQDNYNPGVGLTTKRKDNIIKYLSKYNIPKDRIGINKKVAQQYEFVMTETQNREDFTSNAARRNATINSGASIKQSENVNVDMKNVVSVKDVLFDFNSSSLKNDDIKNLSTLAEFLYRNPDASIKLIGYTDTIGSRAYNEKLSYKRAKAVKDFLLKKKADPKKVIIEKFGESTYNELKELEKIDKENAIKLQQKYRRVAIVVTRQPEDEYLEIEH